MTLCPAATTVRTVDPLTDLTFAEIVVVPMDTAVATPDASIVATLVSEVVQAVLLSGSVAVDPSLSVAFATKVCVAPTAIVGLAGVGVIVLMEMPLPPPSKRSNGLPKQPARPIERIREKTKSALPRLGTSKPVTHPSSLPRRAALICRILHAATKSYWAASGRRRAAKVARCSLLAVAS